MPAYGTKGKWLSMVKKAPSKAVIRRKKPSATRQPVRAYIPRISSRAGPGRGNRAFVEFIYSEKFTINPPAAGLLGTYQFNLNGLFDPNITGGGHQPVNFDQIALMYERYQVNRVQIRASLVSSGSQQIAGITVTRDVTVPAAFEIPVENGMTQWGHVDASGSGQAVKEFVMDVDLPKLWGMTMSQFNAHDRTDAPFTANPAETAVLLCWVCDAQLGDPGACAWAVEIRYFTEVYGSKLNLLS